MSVYVKLHQTYAKIVFSHDILLQKEKTNS